MEPYIIIFIINLLLSYVANNFYNKNIKGLSVLCLIMLITTNVVFSGFRDFGVGIDTNVYIDRFFSSAQSLKSLKDFFMFEEDKGYLVLAYLASLFSDESQSLLVVTSLFIQVMFYLTIWQYKKVSNISIFLATAFFCILFYCHTLNLMRQFCAIVLLSYAFSLYIQGKRQAYLILQVLAYFFHSSSVLFIFVPVLWEMSKIENDRKKYIYYIIFTIVLLAFTSSYYYFISLFGNIGIISDVYSDRYNASGDFVAEGGQTKLGIQRLIRYCYPVAFAFYAIYKKALDNKQLFFVLALTTTSSILQSLSLQVLFVDRLAFYFGFVSFIFTTKIFMSRRISTAVKVVVIFLYVLDWYNLYILGGGGDIIPYKSKILGIM